MSANNQIVVVEKVKDKEYWIYHNGCVDNEFDEETSRLIEKVIKTDDEDNISFIDRLFKTIETLSDEWTPEYGVDWIYLRKEMDLKLPCGGFQLSKNEYTFKFIKWIKGAVIEAINYPEKRCLDNNLETIINEIYEDGFQDGTNEALKEDKDE